MEERHTEDRILAQGHGPGIAGEAEEVIALHEALVLRDLDDELRDITGETSAVTEAWTMRYRNADARERVALDKGYRAIGLLARYWPLRYGFGPAIKDAIKSARQVDEEERGNRDYLLYQVARWADLNRSDLSGSSRPLDNLMPLLVSAHSGTELSYKHLVSFAKTVAKNEIYTHIGVLQVAVLLQLQCHSLWSTETCRTWLHMVEILVRCRRLHSSFESIKLEIRRGMSYNVYVNGGQDCWWEH